ncbi:MAG TPA: DUF998 domain-containing protein [Thermoplasmata archaeon]|nr:DUF998 domain-containing protein [Thermoplasmata archaeon]
MESRLGPLVHRIVRPGAALVVLGVLQFLAAMIVVQLYFPGYSLLANAISDLGGSQSPAAWVFNLSIRVLGVFTFLGVLLIRSTFPPRRATYLGLGFLLLAGVGAFLVGTFPEQSTWPVASIHAIVSLWTFLTSGLALLFLSLAMLRDTRWEGFRFYTFLSGAITLVALLLLALGAFGALQFGGMERLVVAPILLWGLVVGIHLLRLQVYAPGIKSLGA